MVSGGGEYSGEYTLAAELERVLEDRHPATQQVARWFRFDHLRNEAARRMSMQFYDLAVRLIEQLPDSPELTVALRKLLEGKDAAVRCTIEREAGELL